MGSLRVKLMINKGRRFSPFDDFLVTGFLEVIVVPSEQDKEERSFGQIRKKHIFNTHVSFSVRMERIPRGRVRAPRASGDHGMEPTPKCWERRG